MAHSKKKQKQVKQSFNPDSRQVRTGGNPEATYAEPISWNFSYCDKEGPWAFTKEHIGDDIWDKVIPFFSSVGMLTWGEVLLGAKKQHHTIPVGDLNPCARKRLEELSQYPDVVISFRLGGKIRIYGVMMFSTCCILWYDDDHGDNETCVCRSKKKHT